jgi:hypothetical protein
VHALPAAAQTDARDLVPDAPLVATLTDPFVTPAAQRDVPETDRSLVRGPAPPRDLQPERLMVFLL